MSHIPPSPFLPPPIDLDALIQDVIPDAADWRKRPNSNLDWAASASRQRQG